jgi:Fe2+ or Zn2+ uptake regulation protein
MLELDPADLATIPAILRQKYGFEVNLVHLTLTGLCAACVAQAA